MSSPRRTLLRRALVADDGQEGGEAALNAAPIVAEPQAPYLPREPAIDKAPPAAPAPPPSSLEAAVCEEDVHQILQRRLPPHRLTEQHHRV